MLEISSFQTNNGLIYEVVFKPSGYIFDESAPFYNNVFEFAILVAENPSGKNPPLDKLIPNTIAGIFDDFFKKSERVVIYICETSDYRASARNRKFNQWFDWYKGTDFMKIDMQMGQDVNGQNYFASMIVRIDNPLIGEIVVAFRDFIMSNQK